MPCSGNQEYWFSIPKLSQNIKHFRRKFRESLAKILFSTRIPENSERLNNSCLSYACCNVFWMFTLNRYVAYHFSRYNYIDIELPSLIFTIFALGTTDFSLSLCLSFCYTPYIPTCTLSFIPKSLHYANFFATRTHFTFNLSF